MKRIEHLTELVQVFGKLGFIGFGGPAAHIALMEQEVVKRRAWLTQDHFLDLLGATNLIPGPNSTEMALHIGFIRGRWLGLIIAGLSFILPAVTITGILAGLYVAYGALPQVAPILYGIKPAVFAVILDALWRLGQKAVKNRQLLLLAIAVALMVLLFNVSEIVAILVGGLLGMVWLRQPPKKSTPDQAAQGLMVGAIAGSALKAAAVTNAVTGVNVWQLGWIFLKIGSLLFGGGYVLFAFLQGSLVEEHHWLTQQQLLDAIAIGQLTPGPILSTATFIGYVLAGLPGAGVATVGIFLPSFLFVAALNPLVSWLRASSWTAAFLDSVNVSALALIAVVAIQLGQTIFLKPVAPYGDWIALAIAGVSLALTLRFRLNATWLVLGGAAAGWLVVQFM
ncbi:MAG: chromate efflux transporter [Thermosynechococcaceae cyanobacterium]